MNRNNGNTTIGMLNEVVASLNSSNLKSGCRESANDLFSG